MAELAFTSTLPIKAKSSSTFRKPLSIAPFIRRAKHITRAALPSNQVSSNQWDQHDNKDSKLDQQLKIACSYPSRQRHTHIFFQSFTRKPFAAAANRFLNTIRTRQVSPRLLWLLCAVPDPYFGSLRGEPHPPRCIAVTPLTDDYDGADIRRWVSALDRVGPALTPMDSHFVDWAVCHTTLASNFDSPPMQQDWYVAVEILNANWSDAKTVPQMRSLLIQHSEDVVDAGYASSFQVFQSVDSPTCFKTMEVYSSLDNLQKCLQNLDEPFATDMLKCRAAVNRVRQLNQCIGYL